MIKSFLLMIVLVLSIDLTARTTRFVLQGSVNSTNSYLAKTDYAPGRLLVKFQRASKEAPGFQHHVAQGIAQTGLASMDQLNSQLKVSEIRRAYAGVKNKALEREPGIDCRYLLTFPEGYDMKAMAALYKRDKHVAEVITLTGKLSLLMFPTMPHNPVDGGFAI